MTAAEPQQIHFIPKTQASRQQARNLPAYSPELNPMENVWEFLRGNKLSALIWDNDNAIVDACVSAWHFLIGNPKRIRSIGSRDWVCVSL